MSFSESEVRFLMQPNRIEHAAGDRVQSALLDLRQMGCPSDVFNRILNHRAAQLGRRFAEFRAANSSRPTVVNDVDPASMKLF